MPQFKVVSEYTPPATSRRPLKSWRRDWRTACASRCCWRHRQRQDLHHGQGHREGAASHAGAGPQQDAGGPAVREFREFFPENAVEYFVSYYDYYQPEAYIPHTDTFIEKDAAINAEIERLRHSATATLFERRDVIVVASVSCIYGLGDPIDYANMVISLRRGRSTHGISCCGSW